MADQKVIQKSISFHKKQQQMYDFSKVANRPTPAVHYAITSASKAMLQCTIPSQVHRRPYIALEGSAQLTSGDIGSDDEAQDWFLPREVNPK